MTQWILRESYATRESQESKERFEDLQELADAYLGIKKFRGNNEKEQQEAKETFLAYVRGMGNGEIAQIVSYLDFVKDNEPNIKRMKVMELKAGIINIQRERATAPQTGSAPPSQSSIEIKRGIDAVPSVIQAQFISRIPPDTRNAPDKRTRLIMLEQSGVSFRFSDSKFSSEELGVFLGATERDQNGREVPFSGILQNGEKRSVRFRFEWGRYEEMQMSYENGMLVFEKTTYPNFRQEMLVNATDIARGQVFRVAFGPGADKRGDGYRFVVNFQLRGQ